MKNFIKQQMKISRSIYYTAGILSCIFSIFFFYISFSEGLFSDDFLSILSMAIVSGLFSFMCFSSWKRINFLISGIMFLSAGVWMLIGLLDYRYIDFWLSSIWMIVFLLIGLSLLFRFFNTSIFQSIRKMSQNKTIRLIAKIIFWSTLVIIGLLVITGLFSLLAGLSATTIIIILLVLILLKLK